MKNVDAAPELVTAAQATTLLGIKPATLYAYVSRGLVRAVGSSRGAGHLYAREDLTRLLLRKRARSGHAGAAASALLWGDPVLDSEITAILARGPCYRGRYAVDLVASATPFEAAAARLWGTSPAAWPAPRGRRPRRERGGLGGLFEVLGREAAAGASRTAEVAPAEPGEELARAAGAIARLAEAVGAGARWQGSVARTVACGLGLRPRAEVVAALDAALVLVADHELNASSFACRVAASTGAPLEACMLAGLSALAGPRHGMASLAAVRLLGLGRGRALAEIARLRRAGAALPGFGHPLYPSGDPRGAALIEIARALAGRLRRWEAVEAVLRAARRRGERPNVDFGLAALSLALRAPADAPVLLFALGRTAGWVAHALEQRAQGSLLRPRARYVGPAPA